MMIQIFKYELYDQRYNQNSDYELIMANDLIIIRITK